MKIPIILLIITSIVFAVVPHGETVDVDINEDYEITRVSSLEVDLPGGIQYGEHYEPVDPATLADPHDPTSNFEYIPPVQRAVMFKDEGPGSLPYQGSDWYDDILIYGGEVGNGQDFDVDELTDDIYACFTTEHATNDSLVVYRSTDAGNTWSYFDHSTNSTGGIYNPCIRVVRDSSGDS